MPVKGRQAPDEALQTTLYRAANRAATQAVIDNSKLRGPYAERIAHAAVQGAYKNLKAAWMARVLGTSRTETNAVAVAALTMLALNLVVTGSVIRDGGRVSRVAAGAAMVGHVGFYWYSQARDRQLRTAVALRAEP